MRTRSSRPWTRRRAWAAWTTCRFQDPPSGAGRLFISLHVLRRVDGVALSPCLGGVDGVEGGVETASRRRRGRAGRFCGGATAPARRYCVPGVPRRLTAAPARGRATPAERCRQSLLIVLSAVRAAQRVLRLKVSRWLDSFQIKFVGRGGEGEFFDLLDPAARELAGTWRALRAVSAAQVVIQKDGHL